MFAINEITENLVGKRVWFFHPQKGVTSILVTGLYKASGRRKRVKWGLFYDKKDIHGSVYSRVIWVKDYPLFTSRLRCEKWVKAKLDESNAAKSMDKLLEGDSL